MASQEQRKAETRARLLDAAAELFAAHGIEAMSIEGLAEAADRTSGAVYAHFGGKEGLLSALLEERRDATAEVVASEFDRAESTEAQLAAIWRNIADPPAPGGRNWVLLEHELWLYAARHAVAAERLAARYREIRAQLAVAVNAWADDDGVQLPAEAEAVPALLVGLLLGLEMQHRVDPDAVPDDLALAGLRALAGLPEPKRRRAR